MAHAADASDNSVQALWRVPKWFPDLSKETLDLLQLFHVELLHFNAKINLIGRGTERDADEMHFADAILGAQIMLKDCRSKVIYDVGSGNGLPGVALAILDPKRSVILVEKDMRKSEFLKQIVFRLKISNVEVRFMKFESMEPGSVETAVSRGFASISKAILMGNKCFHKGSSYYHFKTSNWPREIAEIPSQVCAVWTPALVSEYSLPVTMARRAIVVTRKIA